MSDSLENHALDREFDLDGYVSVTSDAASRTRTVTIVLVVASVLIGIGWYNTLSSSWQLHRLRQAYNLDEGRVCELLDCAHNPKLKEKEDVESIKILGLAGLGESGGKSPVSKFRDQIRHESMRAYIDNVRSIRAPFFGIAFDANDLGVIGGVTLILILLMMRYSLSREIKNLNVSLREAVIHDRLPGFYHAVAMRQVFTVPHMKGEKKNQWLAASPRAICVLPVLVFTSVVVYDYYSTYRLGVVRPGEVSVALAVETVWLGLIVYLAARCWERQSHIDGVWKEYWKRLDGKRSRVVRLRKDLVEEFGSDEDVDKALRRFRSEDWALDEPF
ncbi:MAG: hypothetical protein H7Z16_06450 [Pyrinomonadaceae bacterium]|nr:hypothetical protein [Pyrinomonadaceae bacterium]